MCSTSSRTAEWILQKSGACRTTRDRACSCAALAPTNYNCRQPLALRPGQPRTCSCRPGLEARRAIARRFKAGTQVHAYFYADQMVSATRGHSERFELSWSRQSFIMLIGHRRLRRWAAQMMLVWLFGLETVWPTPGRVSEPQRRRGGGDRHAGAPSWRQAGGAAKVNCLDFCEKSSIGAPQLKAVDDGIAALGFALTISDALTVSAGRSPSSAGWRSTRHTCPAGLRRASRSSASRSDTLGRHAELIRAAS